MSSKPVSPTTSRYFRTLAIVSSLLSFWTYMMLASTVRHGRSLASWKT